jgi:GDP-4-dehydro-6-deoxy-D-mannose reductase
VDKGNAVMKYLVTGSSGFVGSHLVAYLEEQGHDVYEFDLKEGYDFRDYEQIRLAIDTIRPEGIFHIGALAYVPESFLDPVRAIETNIIGSLNILEAVRKIGLKTKIHLCGSSEEYGDTLGLVTEDSSPNPLSPYAVSKLGMDYLGQLYAKAYHMDIVITRTFNHTGPGRGEQYAESSWAKQIVEIEQGKRDVLLHGDLRPIRNYTDVRDIVRAYSMAIDLPSGVYNICSDQNVTMQSVLDQLLVEADLDIQTKEDSTLLRPVDFSFNEPSCKKFIKLTGWKPEIKLKQTLKDVLVYWQDEV